MFSWFKKPDPESDEALVAEVKQKFYELRSLARRAKKRNIVCKLSYIYESRYPYIDRLDWGSSRKFYPDKRFD